jgi:hypothetical protein
MWKLLHKQQLQDKSNLKKPRRSKDRKKSAIKRKLEKELRHFAEGNKDANGSMGSLSQRELITEFQKKSMNSCMK